MRLARDAAQLPEALQLARSEARNAFGSDELILERAIQAPRHVEVQIFADQQGNTVHLGERDCSVQRRHQKVVEEAPSPVMTPHLRTAMGTAAIAAAQAVNYVGAGTIEFLLEDTGNFYFLEMNTRLQVEHPVTEIVTGRDLVALQLSVAAGKPLGFTQQDITLNGHAIEVRLYGEDPANDFLPSTGHIHLWEPPQGAGIRVDSGIGTGQPVSPFYDPMLAKIIASSTTRTQARERLIQALRDTVVFGVTTNRDFLIEVLEREAFARGSATTAFIEQEFPKGISAETPFDAWARAAFELRQARAQAAQSKSLSSAALMGWSSTGVLRDTLTLRCADAQHRIVLEETQDGVRISSDLGQGTFTPDGRYNGVRQQQGRVLVDADLNGVHMALGAHTFRFECVTAASSKQSADRTDVIVAQCTATC